MRFPAISSIRSRAPRRSRLLRAALLPLAALAPAAASQLTAQVSVRGAMVQECSALPGAVCQGTVLIDNASNQPQAVRAYLTDYWFEPDGTTRYDAPGTQARSNAPWVALSAPEVTVPARGEAMLHYTVQVPASSPAAGTYWSIVMVEAALGPEAARKPGEVALGTTTRYGVQVVSHVSLPDRPAPAPALEISAPRVASADTAAGASANTMLEFDVRNTGAVAVRPELSVELFDAAGRSVGVFRERRGLLYPGTGLRQRFPCPGLAPARYRAVVLVDTGGDEVFGAELPLVVERAR